MPTYDYACKACGRRFETFQSMRDEPLTTCPHCDAVALHRLIGAGAGLVFKGSGFYLTDYKKGNGSATSTSASTPTGSKASNGTSPGSNASSGDASGTDAVASSTASNEDNT